MTDKLAELGAGLLIDHKKDVTLAIGTGGLLRVLQTERDAPCHSDQADRLSSGGRLVPRPSVIGSAIDQASWFKAGVG
jgi:hypothetical protein